MRQIDRQAGFATPWSALATTSAAPGRASSSGLRLRRSLDTLRLWRERVRGRQQLRTYDDHLLRDIGITRLQAEAEAHKPFWRA